MTMYTSPRAQLFKSGPSPPKATPNPKSKPPGIRQSQARREATLKEIAANRSEGDIDRAW